MVLSVPNGASLRSKSKLDEEKPRSGMPEEPLNISPVPLSRIVAVPVELVVPVLVAVNVNVSPLSGNASLLMVVRTNKVVPVVGICTKLLGV